MNTVGNIFSGQVVGDTARMLSERFGRIVQQRESMNINRNETSMSVNTQLDSLIPAAKISNLSQGMFVGAVADNFGEEVRQKVFHAQIVVDSERVKHEEKAYKPLPEIYSFRDEEGRDTMQQEVQDNYRRIKKGGRTNHTGRTQTHRTNAGAGSPTQKRREIDRRSKQ